ncbi:transcription factor bHLH110 isoform X2 [Telopea speciosissima]|uniref:transcription factor bHLH110 isoform X2 n=1 Tax=Telopea speciosissima TaxID=54955 RepID=UPI001CC7C2F2|nr:transcription factor bHLH110 isoform X2 [Telopea speciosissima]
MESANLNLHHQHHQLQDQLIGSSSLSTPSFYGVPTTRSWNSNLSLSDGDFNPNVSGVLLSNPRDSRQNNSSLESPLNASMIQELGFNWANNAGSFTNHSAHHLQLAKIKEEFSDSLPKFSDSVNNPSNLEEFHLPSTRYIKGEQQDFHELGGKIFFKNFSSGNCQSNIGPQLSAGDLYSNAPQSCTSFGGNLNQIFPTSNISSNMNPLPPSTFSSSLDMNLQALDLLNSTKFGGSFSQLSQNNIDLSPNNLNKISSFKNGVAETKRPSNFPEAKASHGATNKKGRFESRSSFPPFKVRKEKLGDRIAALQQLVAPFGKTDTASVLMEAIGYIKFLQEQVETLSLPYLKSSRNKTCRTISHGGSSEEDRNEEPKRDLRSRGLCLVPLSCTSYLTHDIGGVWPPPNFS